MKEFNSLNFRSEIWRLNYLNYLRVATSQNCSEKNDFCEDEKMLMNSSVTEDCQSLK